jgi:hypothetical protein
MSESAEQPKDISRRILSFQDNVELNALHRDSLIRDLRETLASQGVNESVFKQTFLWHELLGSTPDGSIAEKDVPGNLIENFLDEKLRSLGI